MVHTGSPNTATCLVMFGVPGFAWKRERRSWILCQQKSGIFLFEHSWRFQAFRGIFAKEGTGKKSMNYVNYL